MMPLGIDFWDEFRGFWERKWNQVGTQIEPKIHVNIEMRFEDNRALTAVGARIFWIRGSKLGAKIDQKSMKK